MKTLAVEGTDSLSVVLDTLRLRSRVFCQSDFGAPWGFRVAARDVVTYHLLVRGFAEVRVDGVEDVFLLSAGDLLIVPHGNGHEVRDAPGSPAIPLEELVELTPPDARGVMRSGGAGPRSTFLCGGFFFESQPEVRPALLQRLPPVLHAPGGGRSGSALMRVVEMIRDELASGAPGGGVMVDRLMEMLFVQAVRAHLSAHGPARGWLPGIADPKLGKVLARLHRDLAADWTVDRLAGVAGMSRTAFTERFTAVIGVPPLTYVSRCRMDEAMRLLRDQNRTLAEVAEAVGYKSQFAFGKAFKRQLGIGPGAFRRSHVLPPVPEVVGAEERLGA